MKEYTNTHEFMGPDSEPLFGGLRHAGVTGRDVAKALRLSPATVSKWRRGHARIPADIQVFLTLLLADHVDRLGDMYATWGPAPASWHLSVRAGMEAARDALSEQENRNRILPPAAVHDGARRFRVWWNAERIAGDNSAKPVPAVMQAALQAAL